MKLFESTATSFLDNGLGVLHPLKCIEHKKKSLNGWYVECEFPISYKEKIVQGAILYVETKEKGGQPFRCNNPKYKDRKIKVTANHVVFDSEKYILEDVRPTDLAPVSFLKWINERTDISSPFSVSSDVTGSETKYFIRKTLLYGFKEAEAMFGGSYDVDGFNVNLKTEVGTDDGFSVAYGKNLQSISIIEDWSTVCTKVLPVGPNGLKLPEVYLYTEIQYDIPYSKVVEFNIPTSYENENGETIDYTTEELIVMLREEAQKYISDSYIPKINYVVKSDVPQSLRIGDVVHVKHPILTIDTEVQAYEYDTISKCVLALEFGNYERDVKKLFDSIKTSVEEAKTNASGALIVASKQTDLINSLNKKGLVYIDDNEILVLDALPRENAQKVLRIGLGGIGFSSNGYEGPFEYALTQDGWFNIDFIKANSINVNHLSSDVGASLDLSSNESIKFMITNTGGNNLIVNSMGTFEDGWDGNVLVDTSTVVKNKNIYGYALSMPAESRKQIIQVPAGTYTLSFLYKKNVELANCSLMVNGTEFILSNTELTEIVHTFEVNAGSITIELNSDTDGSCTLINLMFNQGSQKMVWSLNKAESWTENVKMSASGLEITNAAADVLFSAKADIIGFKNRNTGEYVSVFTDTGMEVDEIIVRKKANIGGLLIQRINDQVIMNNVGGVD